MMGMNVRELQQRRAQLKDDIERLLYEFQKETAVNIKEVRINTDADKYLGSDSADFRHDVEITLDI